MTSKQCRTNVGASHDVASTLVRRFKIVCLLGCIGLPVQQQHDVLSGVGLLLGVELASAGPAML